tara:strand:- start:40198 stop:41358 length:1161 start_codon:yes stop_codon:yes gene_type:complete
MTELSKKFADARKHLRDVDWTPERHSAVHRNIGRRLRRFTLSTVAVGSAALAVAVAVAIVWFAQGSSTERRVAVAPSQIELHDGTRAAPLGGASSLKLVSENDSLVTFSLEAGKGWFEVTPSRTRRVEVLVRDVRVEVLGTEFVVEVKGDIVHVWVHRGKVSVASKSGTVVLRKGEHGTFETEDDRERSDPEALAENGEDEASVVAEDGASAAANADAGVGKTPSEREASNDGLKPSETRTREIEMMPLPVEEPPSPVAAQPDAVDTLWKQADAARRRGDLKIARSILTQLLNEHEDDPRAALAAFSLGRVLLDSGSSAKTAARAFAKARKLSPDGPLVEDALLREIEAWHDAGDSRRAEKRSEKYLRLFPSGRYRRQIRDMGASE